MEAQCTEWRRGPTLGIELLSFSGGNVKVGTISLEATDTIGYSGSTPWRSYNWIGARVWKTTPEWRYYFKLLLLNNLYNSLHFAKTMATMRISVIAIFLIALPNAWAIGRYRGLEFLEPCARSNPNLEQCLARSANSLTEHFRHGELIILFYYDKLRRFFFCNGFHIK